MIPSTILFVASDAFPPSAQISIADGNSCPKFDRWLQLKRFKIAVDFRRILRVGSGFSRLGDYMANPSSFLKRRKIEECSQVSNEICCRIEDQVSMVVKSTSFSEWIEKFQIENEIENLINLHHLCIVAPIGFVLQIESGSRQELNVVRLYVEGSSLAEVLSISPIW
jgi:hypothetical protein